MTSRTEMLAPPRLREALAFYRTRRGLLVVHMKGRPALLWSNGPALGDGESTPSSFISTGNVTSETPKREERPRGPA